MGKLMVGLMRILPLCAVVLVLPAIAASQSPPVDETFPAKPSDWVLILNVAVSVVTLVVMAWLYHRISQSQVDDNLMNATNSILALFEKVKTLHPNEQRILVHWLNDLDYFTPPPFMMRKEPKVKPTTIEELKQYFNQFAADDQSSQHSQ